MKICKGVKETSMELNEMIEKIKEWENDRNNCATSTMKGLLQEIIDIGKCIINNFDKLTYVFRQNEDRFNQCVKSLQKILDNKDMNAYVSLCGRDIEQATNEMKKEFEIDEKELRNSKEVKDILESWKGLSLDEIIRTLDDLTEEVNRHNELVKQKILKNIELQINALSMIFHIDSLLFANCLHLIEGVFNYHDYGQWEKIKEGVFSEIKSKLLSVNFFFQLTEKIANIVNLFDKEEIKKEFYFTTENNIAKVEGQINALNFVKIYMDLLIEYYEENKFDLVQK